MIPDNFRIIKFCPNCLDPLLVSDEKGMIFQRICKCEQKERAVSLARKMWERGIAPPIFQKMTFESDKGYNPTVINKARKYVDNFSEISAANIGLIFYGGVGTGKTFAAGCIANALINEGYTVIMLNPGAITNLDPRNEYDKKILKSISEADLVVFDDLGSERNTEYATERIFIVLNDRINADKPIICTTNKEPREMAGQDMTIEQKRIYDRILGVTCPIRVDGDSIREKEKHIKVERLKQIFAAAASGSDQERGGTA